MTSFGLYTRAYPRQDGKHRIRFEVPPRLRPEGWPYSKPIYLRGEDGVDLDALTADQDAELRRQAKAHYIDYKRFAAAASAGSEAAFMAAMIEIPCEDDWDELVAIRKDSESWRSLAERTQENYSRIHEQLMEICRRRGLSLKTARESQFERALREEFPSRWTRRKVYSELHVLIEHALVEDMRPAHLRFRPKVRAPKTEIILWDESDLHAMVISALRLEEPGLALLILAQWEIGQRLTSARNFRYGHQYRDGMFLHTCRKTGREVRIPILNPSARKLFDRDYRHGDYMFVRRQDGQPFTETKLTKALRYVRDRTPGYEQSGLVIRALRHTCILNLARSGCTVPEICSVTGHSPNWVHQTLLSYLGRDAHMAHIAMAKRERARVDGIEGEVIIEEARRIFLGPIDPAAKALTPKELLLYGG